MRKYLTLTKILMKSGFQVTDGKSKRWFKLFIYLILFACCLPMLVLLYFGIDSILPLYAQMDQTATILGSMLFFTCMIIFFFSLFLIPSIFYFSSDLEILLALPLKSIHIIAAKFTVCVIYEYLFSFSVLIPTYAAYLHYGGMPMTFLPFGIITLLLIPIFPLVLSTIFTILLMRFVPFFKNRDRFNLISSILLIVVGMSYSLFMNGQNTQDESAILMNIIAGENSLLQFFMKLFPMIPFFARAVVEGSILDLAEGIGICVIALIVFLTLGRFLYFKGAIGSSESTAAHKQMSTKQLQKNSRKRSKTYAYLKKEFKLLLRTPAYFTNCILMIFLFPIIILVTSVLNRGEFTEGFSLSDLLMEVEQIDGFIAYVVFIAMAAGFLFGTLNQISATSLSREGKQYTIMKYIPMSYRDQIHAKMLCGVIGGIVSNLCVVLVLALILPFSWHYYVIYCIVSAITTLIGNTYCMFLDLLKPKLIWEQEVSAVKQNLGAFIAMMISMALCFSILFGCFYLPQHLLMPVMIAAVIVMVLIAILAYILIGKYAEHKMRKL